MTRHFRLFSIPLLALLLIGSSVTACPFCSVDGKTLTQEVSQAQFVVLGTLSNPRLEGSVEGGKTDLIIEKVIKPHSFLLGKKKLELNRYIPVTEETKKQKFLVFCDLYKGKADAYRGMPLKEDSLMPKYLEGALKRKDLKTPERLKFLFPYLGKKEFAVSNDAYMEFGLADYKDYKDLAKELDPKVIAGWLSSPDLRSYRVGLYASMLGHCSKEKDKDTKLLRSLIEDPDSKVTTGVDGVLAAMVMIQQGEGWKYLKDTLSNASLPFTRRYAALRAVRFLIDYRSDLISKKEIVSGLEKLLDQSDIADLAIEDLRKRKYWELTDKVISLASKESHDIPIVKRSILKFALSSPDQNAAAYVAKVRKADPELVTDTQELLKLEKDSLVGSK